MVECCSERIEHDDLPEPDGRSKEAVTCQYTESKVWRVLESQTFVRAQLEP